MADALTTGGWIKRQRKRLGLTQKELARRIGYAEVTVRKAEADEIRLSHKMAEGLAEALQIPAERRAQFVQLARDDGTWDAADLPDGDLPALVVDVRAARPRRLNLIPVPHQIDWGEAPDVSRFHGRQSELQELQRWMEDAGCRLVAVLGMGGIGKTMLATLAAANVEQRFAGIIWRSLRNAPPLAELLRQCLELLAGDEVFELPPTEHGRVSLLMEYLRGARCLLVLDNFETVLDAARPGHYLPGYEGYGQLLREIGEGRHQSCLLLTSREKPKELIPLAGEAAPVRTLVVASLAAADGRALLQDRGLRGGDEQWDRLHMRFSGNPLALQIAAETIRELFDGDIGDFLNQEPILFGGINDLLAQQLARLSPLEEEIMFWLAVEREPVTAQQLAGSLVRRPAQADVLAALHALRQRFLVERAQGGFTLQNVVLEYFSATLIDQAAAEIRAGSTRLLHTYALLKATAKSYVRESQRNLLAGPIARRLVESLGRETLDKQFDALLAELRHSQRRKAGYGGGNVLNLLVLLGYDLRGRDFSQLAIWEADLRNVNAEEVNFRDADLAHSEFTEPFAGVVAVAYSCDGEQLAAGTTVGEIRTWDARTQAPLLTWDTHTGWVRSICYSPDSSILASSGGNLVRLWQARNGGPLATLQGHTADITSVCFSADTKLLASASMDATIRIWDVQTGACLHVLRGHTSIVHAACFHPDGKVVASAGEDKTVRLWSMETGDCLRILPGHSEWVAAVAFSPDGAVLASSGGDSTVRLWHPHSGECMRSLQGHRGAVVSLCFGYGGTVFASGSTDGTVRIWDLGTGQCLHTLSGHSGSVMSAALNDIHGQAASCSLDQTVRIWDARSGQCLNVLHGHSDWVLAIGFHPTRNLLASGSLYHSIRLWDTDSKQCLRTLTGHTSWVLATSFSPEGEILASASGDGTVRLWDPQTGACLRLLRGHEGGVSSVCFSRDGKVVASGGVDKTIRLWDRYSGECLRILEGHTADIRNLCYSPDGKILASTSGDETIRLWEWPSGECVKTLRGHTATTCSVCFAPLGNLLASGSFDQTVRLWDTQTGDCVQVLNGHDAWVFGTSFSPDGSYLASASSDQTVRLWDPWTGEQIATLQGHTSDVEAVCFSAGGSTLASCGDDEAIRLWDVGTWECCGVLCGEGPYARMNIAGVTGVTAARVDALRRLGAIDEEGRR